MRYCAQARAVENAIYLAIVNVAELPEVENFLIDYGLPGAGADGARELGRNAVRRGQLRPEPLRP